MRTIRFVHVQGALLNGFYGEMNRLAANLRDIPGLSVVEQDIPNAQPHWDMVVVVLDHWEEDTDRFLEKLIVRYSGNNIPISGFIRRGTKAPTEVSRVINQWRYKHSSTAQDIFVYDQPLNILSAVRIWYVEELRRDEVRRNADELAKLRSRAPSPVV